MAGNGPPKQSLLCHESRYPDLVLSTTSLPGVSRSHPRHPCIIIAHPDSKPGRKKTTSFPYCLSLPESHANSLGLYCSFFIFPAAYPPSQWTCIHVCAGLLSIQEVEKGRWDTVAPGYDAPPPPHPPPHPLPGGRAFPRDMSCFKAGRTGLKTRDRKIDR